MRLIHERNLMDMGKKGAEDRREKIPANMPEANKRMKDMEIIEQQVVGKSPKTKSEDGIVVTKDFIAVIDGSTSKTDRRVSRWYSNGRYAMKIISDYIRHAPAGISCTAFCAGVTEAVHKKYSKKDYPLYEEHPEERLTASVIVFSRLQRQIWMIGDCQCLVGTNYFENAKPSEAAIALRRAEKAHELIGEGRATKEDLLNDDQAREAVIPKMIESMKGQNRDYAVVDGFPIPMNKVKILTLDFEPFTLVLASDGYPFLKQTLEESENALRLQKENDPLNIGDYHPADGNAPFVATKAFKSGYTSFDDRAYIRFKV